MRSMMVVRTGEPSSDDLMSRQSPWSYELYSKGMCYINTFARSWSWLWWRICDPCYLLVMWATRWLLCHCDTWCVGILYNCLTCSMYATVMKSPLLANYIWLQLAITIEVLDSAINLAWQEITTLCCGSKGLNAWSSRLGKAIQVGACLTSGILEYNGQVIIN